MIKKILWLLVTVCFSFGFMFADYFYQTFPVNQLTQVQDTQHDYFQFNTNVNFLYGSSSNKVFSFYGSGLYPSLWNLFRANNWNNKELYVMSSCEGWYDCQNIHTSIKLQWFVKNFCLTWYLDICESNNLDIWLFYNGSDYANPTSMTVYGWYLTSPGSTNRNWQYFGVCFNYQSFEKSACIRFDRAYSNNNVQNSLNFAYNPFWNDIPSDIQWYITTSPFNYSPSPNVTNPRVVYNNTTHQDIIDYFEQNNNYWFEPSICYVWTNDLTSPYWTSWLSFTLWEGKTIFQLYESIYWTWKDNNSVWVWLNSWAINWDQWFLTSPDRRLYLADYTGWKLVLRYEDLTFPFANKPVAIYFMTNNLMDYNLGSDWNQWYQVAVYCDYILNWDNAEDIDKDYLKNNIENFIDNRNKNVWQYQNPGWDVNSWFWARLWVYDNSWDKQDFTSNFKNFFNKWTSQFDNYENSLTAIIPEYILWFLLLIMLFKFLRKF